MLAIPALMTRAKTAKKGIGVYTSSSAGRPHATPSLKGGTTQCILSQPGFLQPTPALMSPANCLGPVPGTGIGMYATCTIAVEELIVSERPLLVVPGAYHS
ncbi:hypothetical protein HETIRDRAFT_109218 [Heterobasidion irregulare TC 32-1]|uniref:Uncharacterized protein n=1 Tax=Heterobasidion irregulare (strain TC 32-1) TaxID=747525 RepID=W4KIQ4_HETIT|nr:uncharacterized protein HETIRDRAFT_109218 [Heterobasidion irregulare TC 32-1]ETW84931.1 hypothetical protein HETIRDRAFT_109218 [Heterobasidion irregulare TC 32-1]